MCSKPLKLCRYNLLHSAPFGRKQFVVFVEIHRGQLVDRHCLVRVCVFGVRLGVLHIAAAFFTVRRYTVGRHRCLCMLSSVRCIVRLLLRLRLLRHAMIRRWHRRCIDLMMRPIRRLLMKHAILMGRARLSVRCRHVLMRMSIGAHRVHHILRTATLLLLLLLIVWLHARRRRVSTRVAYFAAHVTRRQRWVHHLQAS